MKEFFFSLMLIILNLNMLAQDNSKTDGNQLNKIIVDTNINKEIMIGQCDKNGIESFAGFNLDFRTEYDDYQVNKELLSQYKDILSNYRITIVMGTWCGDSKREVPRFFKIIDELGISEDIVTIICVDRKKKAGDLEIEKFQIKLVPTFIFTKDNIEKGRIVEQPKENLESDIIQIIK